MEVALLLLVSMVHLSMTRSVQQVFDVHVLPDGSEEYKVSISSPNVTLMHVSLLSFENRHHDFHVYDQDYVFICASAEVPFGSEETYISE